MRWGTETAGRSKWAGAAIAWILLCGVAHGQVSREHAIPSCYEDLAEYAPREAPGDLTVMIDQTAYLDAQLRRVVHEAVERLIRPGTRVTIVAFSAYTPGRYLDVLASGLVEYPISGSTRDWVSKRRLKDNDQCLDDQLEFARKLVARAIDRAFARSDVRLPKSDILAALSGISRRYGNAPGGGRIVILASDMMENSSITSFYRGNQLRPIDPDAELKRVSASGLRADFHGARVFVIGAGAVDAMAPTAQSGAYDDPRTLLKLEEFWRRWLGASHAELVEFGTPEPLVEITWANGAGKQADTR